MSCTEKCAIRVSLPFNKVPDKRKFCVQYAFIVNLPLNKLPDKLTFAVQYKDNQHGGTVSAV